MSGRSHGPLPATGRGGEDLLDVDMKYRIGAMPDLTGISVQNPSGRSWNHDHDEVARPLNSPDPPAKLLVRSILLA
jgi:hypothetical protein